MKFVAAALIAIAGLVLAAGGAEAQWTVENGSATACSPPDAVGFAACVRVDQGGDNPWVSVTGDSDVFWETLSLTVDDGEPFISRFAQNGASWGLAGGAYGREQAARIIEALRAGSRVRVRASAAWDYTISLRGSSAAIDKAMSATWTLEGGWTLDPEQARRDRQSERAHQERQQSELAAAQEVADRAAEVARQEREQREQAEQVRREELQAEREQFVADVLNTAITTGLTGPITTATGGLPGGIAGLRYGGGYARMSFPAATASQLSRARQSGGYAIVCTSADLSGDEIELRGCTLSP